LFEKYISEEKCLFYEPALKRSPRKIETLEDFIWFNTFNFRWDESQFALALKLIERWKMPITEYSKVIKNVIGFYYKDYFQQWSIYRNEPQYEVYDFKRTIKLEMRKIMRKYFLIFKKGFIFYVTKKNLFVFKKLFFRGLRY
jgi:hypothetical protein